MLQMVYITLIIPPTSFPQYIPWLQVADEFGLDITNSIYHSITPSTRHAPQPTDYEVEGRESCPKGGKRRRLASGSDAHRQYVVDQSGSRSLKSNEKQGRSARSREAAPAHRVQVRNPKGPSSAGTAQKASNSRYDEVNGDKFILIGDEWSRLWEVRPQKLPRLIVK